MYTPREEADTRYSLQTEGCPDKRIARYPKISIGQGIVQLIKQTGVAFLCPRPERSAGGI